ncbi:hypothetical protein [Pontibacter sp. HSC-36F09]|uniref:hypothetical protein n=1 Tax=Pontibacter sp. HSC-36F09 TaxID=2910966 RepID=UPI00209E396F|nr:hypothetical protein [Pontibacter sp. HSC-36F09]MCP2044750.1 hypothetical protein [Pontibacter sp. HSC-36F09]
MNKLIIVTIYILTCFSIAGCTSNYLDYKEHIETTGRYNYAFYMDSWGIGDQGYYVLQLEKDINPKDVYVEINMDGINHEQQDWMDNRTILFNYAEAGYHYQNPNIKLIDNQFLVFSRGGYFYGLYDLKTQKDTFNIGSPWNEFIEKSGYYSEKINREKEEKEYTSWVEKNIHDNIRKYIRANK